MTLIIARSRKLLSKRRNQRILFTWLPGLLLFTISFIRWSYTSAFFNSVPKTLSVSAKLRKFSRRKPHTHDSNSIPVVHVVKPLYFHCIGKRLQSNCALKPTSGKFDILNPNGRLPGGHSQSREDRYVLERYFFNQRGGTFLEMGGLDGIAYSNSYYWEKYLGWKGLLIEGSPTLYKKLQINRPDAITVNAMVCSEKGKLHWIDSGNAVGGFYELMPKSFVAKWHKRFNKKLLSSYATVPCLRLDHILKENGIVHVDVWTLDVEGAELSVLKTVDFSRFSASVIVVEYRKDSPGIQEFLTEKTYVRVERIGNNNVYLHPMFKSALEELDLDDIPA